MEEFEQRGTAARLGSLQGFERPAMPPPRCVLSSPPSCHLLAWLALTQCLPGPSFLPLPSLPLPPMAFPADPSPASVHLGSLPPPSVPLLLLTQPTPSLSARCALAAPLLLLMRNALRSPPAGNTPA